MAVKVDSLGREIVWLHEPSSRPRDSFPPARLSAADSETAPSHQLYRPGKRQRDGAETFRWGSVCCPRASRGALPLHRYQRFPYATTASFLGRLSMGRLEDRFDAYSVGWRGLLSIPRQAPRLAHRLRLPGRSRAGLPEASADVILQLQLNDGLPAVTASVACAAR